MPRRPRVVSVKAVDLVVEGRERLLLDGLTAISCARLRSCAKATLRSLPSSSTSRYSRCRTLVTAFFGTPLILRFSLRAPSGWTVRMLYILERRPTYSGILAGKVSSRACPAGPSPRWPWRAPLQRARSGPSRGPWTCRPRRRGRRRSFFVTRAPWGIKPSVTKTTKQSSAVRRVRPKGINAGEMIKTGKKGTEDTTQQTTDSQTRQRTKDHSPAEQNGERRADVAFKSDRGT